MSSASPTKMVIVVRTDLSIPYGKGVAQGGHCGHRFLTDRREFRMIDGQMFFMAPVSPDEMAWLDDEANKKVVLRVDSEEELKRLHDSALAAGLISCPIIDNGLTVFKGVRTLTAITIGPDRADRIDAITVQLRPL